MKYALIGSGKVARHLEFYLHALNSNIESWNRRSGLPIDPVLADATHVLLAVSDPSIPQLAELAKPGQIVVHFSGASIVENVFAAHPLMTFGGELQTLEWYKSIPFIIDKGVSFEHILPGLPNKSFGLEKEKRPLYHALCALAGNSAFLLWLQIGAQFELQLELPKELLKPFLHQVVHNAFTASAADNFTGPVARQDWPVVRKHLSVLEDCPALKETYQNFIKQAAKSGVPIPKELQ
jgi:predicted short-subunit dehydrogenase-like oxidoreductase (DUF2520 family)